MFAIDRVLLVGALLVLLGIASSKLSARFGVPVLVLFVLIGMLAGSEGIGGIRFDNYGRAHAAGTVALAIILFDGGLRTPFSAIRPVLAPALSLATLGVAVTAGITGGAAAWLLGVPVLHGLLLGSIVASTDAAAMFSVLRSTGLRLRERVGATLELESGSNDPMAIFLTVGLLDVISGRTPLGAGLALLFAQHMVTGALAGWLVGRLGVWATNSLRLSAEGLYPVFVAACGLLAYGLAAVLHGSGFLAVYLAGIVFASRRLVFRRGILLFHDGAAWLAQVCMFVMLGMLSFPSRLLQVAGPGLIITAVLVLVARPLAVALSLAPLRFSVREMGFVSWAGLKGAVPIVLGTFPLLLGMPRGEALFDVVFFVVLVSALLQGWTLTPVARWLRLEDPAPPPSAVSLEITSLGHVNADIVQYTLSESRPGRTVAGMGLPQKAVVAMIARQERVIPPRGSTSLRQGDNVFVVLTPDVREEVDALFERHDSPPPPARIEFPLSGGTTVAEIEEFYGIRLDPAAGRTLDELLRTRLGDRLEEGRGISVAGVRLSVREVRDGRVDGVGLRVEEKSADPAGSQ